MSLKSADDLLLFKKIVDAGSLSTAAKIGNISVSHVSKRMTALEATLGLQLLQRSTRKISLTQAGELLYHKLGKIKELIDEAWQSVLACGSEPKGELRISAPITYGSYYLMPLIKKFKEAYPQIQVNLDISHNEQPSDDANHDIHIQSHIMTPNQFLPDSNFCAKKIASEQLVFVASKEYIDQHGIPARPENLEQHKCLILNDIKHWTFYRDNEAQQQNVRVEFSANNFKSLYLAAIAGMGVARIPLSLYEQDPENMVRLFKDYSTETFDTYAYYQASQLSLKKVNLFLESLIL